METKSNSLLSVNNLGVVYHHVSRAIQGASFNISEGQLFALIGPNGAGKTTTLRALSGFLGADNAEITDGDIYFMGQQINKLPPYEITNMGIVLVPERNKVFETLTTEENLGVSLLKAGAKKDALQKINRYFPNLHERRYQLAGLLSGGEKQMLSIGQALLCSPKLLLVDELSMGLAPLVLSSLIDTLVEMKKDLNLTILLVEQNAMVAFDIADYGAIMETGKIVFEGTPRTLLTHELVRKFYLGIRENGEESYRDIKQYKRTKPLWG